MWKNLWSRGIQGARWKPTKRFIHTQYGKRPRIPDHKWNHYDELKLMSYSSHLAFFMLLPPVIQMYMTRVEVIRDDTLNESPFFQEEKEEEKGILNCNLKSNHDDIKGLLIKNRLEEQREFFESNVIQNEGNDEGKGETAESIRDNYYDFLLSQVEDSFKNLQLNHIGKQEYINIIESVTSKLDPPNYHPDKDYKNSKYRLVEVVFNQLRWTGCKIQEEILLKKLLTSENNQWDNKILHARQLIIQRYEQSKRNSNSNSNSNSNITRAPKLSTLILQSKWLRHYVNDVERLKQMIMLLIDIEVSKKIFNNFMSICLKNEGVINGLRDHKYELRRVIKRMRDAGRTQEALKLERLKL